MRKVLCHVPVIAVLSVSLVLGAKSIADEPAFAMPKPGPEHEMLKKMEGTWQATVKFGGQESKGTMTCKMECNGLWLVTNYSGQFAGAPFQGRGMDGYDPGQKKFVSVWVDSMGTMPEMMEGTYDKEKKTRTMIGDYTGPDGKKEKHKMVSVHKDEDTFESTFSTVGKDGKDSEMMTITYKRKK